MRNISDLTLRQLWYGILTLIIPFICVGGTTYFPYHFRYPLIIIVAVVSIVISFASKKAIRFDAIPSIWLLVSTLIISTSFISYDKSKTLEFGIIYLASSLMLFVDFSENFWNGMLKVVNVVVIVVAVSIIASVFVDNLMLNYFSFIVNPTHAQSVNAQIASELKIGSYSGLAGEKAEAALIVNVGIALIFAKYFSGIKLKPFDIAESVLLVVALLLTGKRMLFLIPIFLFVIMIMTSHIKYKFLKFLAIAVLAIVGVLIAAEFVPQVSVMYDRMIGNRDKEYYDMLSGREDLWMFSFRMFADSPLLGVGYGSFNLYSYKNGYLYQGGQWNYFGHNCYYELLGEVGIVGAIAIFGLMIASLVYTIRFMRDKSAPLPQRRLMMFSFYIQTMLLIYCASGNPLFMYEQIYMWFIAIAMMLTVYKQRNAVSRRIGGERLYV